MWKKGLGRKLKFGEEEKGLIISPIAQLTSGNKIIILGEKSCQPKSPLFSWITHLSALHVNLLPIADGATIFTQTPCSYIAVSNGFNNDLLHKL